MNIPKCSCLKKVFLLVPVFVSNNIIDEIKETEHMLPLSILEKCISILEERKLKYEEELAAEAEKCQGIFTSHYIHYHPLEFLEEAEGYTSLCGDSDNMYEEINKLPWVNKIRNMIIRN